MANYGWAAWGTLGGKRLNAGEGHRVEKQNLFFDIFDLITTFLGIGLNTVNDLGLAGVSVVGAIAAFFSAILQGIGFFLVP